MSAEFYLLVVAPLMLLGIGGIFAAAGLAFNKYEKLKQEKERKSKFYETAKRLAYLRDIDPNPPIPRGIADRMNSGSR